MAKQTVVAIPGNHHYRAVPSPRARAAGIDRRTLRRALAVVESHERLAAEVQQMADAVAKAIRKRGNRLDHTTLNQWREERDACRDDAQLFRSEARTMARALRLVLRGRFVDAKETLTANTVEPWDRLAKILGPAVGRGLRLGSLKLIRG
jgi:hypothetical protein